MQREEWVGGAIEGRTFRNPKVANSSFAGVSFRFLLLKKRFMHTPVPWTQLFACALGTLPGVLRLWVAACAFFSESQTKIKPCEIHRSKNLLVIDTPRSTDILHLAQEYHTLRYTPTNDLLHSFSSSQHESSISANRWGETKRWEKSRDWPIISFLGEPRKEHGNATNTQLVQPSRKLSAVDATKTRKDYPCFVREALWSVPWTIDFQRLKQSPYICNVIKNRSSHTVQQNDRRRNAPWASHFEFWVPHRYSRFGICKARVVVSRSVLNTKNWENLGCRRIFQDMRYWLIYNSSEIVSVV